MGVLWDKFLEIDFSNVKPRLFNNIEFKDLDENTSFVSARLLNNGTPIVLTGYTVMVEFSTSLEETVAEYATIVNDSNGEIRIPFKSHVLCEGDSNFEVFLVRDNSIKLSPKIWYRVFDSILDKGDVSLESNYPILINLVKDINDGINRADRYSNTLSDKLVDINNATTKAIESAKNADKATSSALDSVQRVNSAIASGTVDLEVKDARISQNGTVYSCLSDRLDAIENNPYVLFETIEG